MRKITQPKLSDIITEQLESMILDGTLVPGQKLPPERELAEQFSVSRPSLREAIQKLAAKGLIERKQGGGNYVKKRLTSSVNDPLMALIAAHPETQYDLLEFRHGLEGMAAYYAALRRDDAQLLVLKARYQDVQAIQQADDAGVEGEAQALAAFYLAMAEATHNVVLLHVMRSMLPLMQDNIRANLVAFAGHDQVGEAIRMNRDKVMQAIEAGKPEAARSASNELLDYIEQTLLDMNQKDSRIQRALRRIDLAN